MNGGEEQTPILARLDRQLPYLYLLFALALTTLLCFLTAPFFGPDESAQSLRAISLSHGHLIEQMGPKEPGGDMDANVVLVMDGVDDIRMAWEPNASNFHDRPWGPMRAQPQQRLAAIRWAHRTMWEPFGNTAVYPPLLYLPSIAGWRIAESLSLTIFDSMRIARLLCALASVLLGWLALRLCACSRWILLPFLILPSTLFLNATASQDAILLSAAALAAALLTRPLVAHRDFTPPELALTAALLTLCAMSRPPYAALGLVLFLPTVELSRPGWRRWLAPTAAFAAVAGLCALWWHLVSALPVDTSDAADPTVQIPFLRAHPFAGALAILRGTAEAALDFVHRGLYVIGWNDLLPHHGAAAVLAVALVLILLLAPSCPIRTRLGLGLLALAVVAPLLANSLAEYIIWTTPGWYTVYGIQPRYWLPVMPFAFLLLQGRLRLPPIPEPLRTRVLLAATAALVLVACTLPWMTALAFYTDTVAHVLRLNLP